MNILLWIVFGGLAGWIASLITGDDARIGIAGNVVIGIIGALIGGWLADKLGVGGHAGAERPTTVWSFIIAVVGSLIVLFLANLFV